MPLFKWSCCRRGAVENQVDVRSIHARTKSPISKHKDANFDSDLQAVQWMRDRSKQQQQQQQHQSISDATEQEENGNSEEEDSPPSSFMKQVPIDDDTSEMAPTDASPSLDGSSTSDDQVCITIPSKDQSMDSAMDSHDVDETTWNRYEKAVTLLHRALLEPTLSLTLSERDLLHQVLSDEENNNVDASAALECDSAESLERDAPCDMQARPPLPPSRRSQQPNYSPPKRQPECRRGVKLSIVKPSLQNSQEEFELMIWSSSSNSIQEDDDDMNIDDDAPLLVIEDDECAMQVVLPESAPPRRTDESLTPYNDDNLHDDDMNECLNDDTSTFPFYILGQSSETSPGVLTPLVLEALRGFLPYVVSEENFWLKYSLIRDGSSLSTLLHLIRASKFTVIAVETMNGDVFGSFTGTPWRIQQHWYGTGDAFLWRCKQSRFNKTSRSRNDSGHDQIQVYPYTGMDYQVQYCTRKCLAVGGGDWTEEQACPYHNDEPRGIGFMLDRNLAFGETNSCATFANPRLSHGAKMNQDFEIRNVEVWSLTPCISLEEALKLEQHKLFVQEQQTGRT